MLSSNDVTTWLTRRANTIIIAPNKRKLHSNRRVMPGLGPSKAYVIMPAKIEQTAFFPTTSAIVQTTIIAMTSIPSP